MADGNRTAVDVVLFVVDFQAVAGIQALRSKGFVQLPQVDVGNAQAFGLEQLGHREHRANTHFIRLTASGNKTTEEGQRLEAQLDGFFQAHHQGHRGAVRQLRRVAGGDRPVIGKHRFERSQAFQGGVGTVAVVMGDHAVNDALLARSLIFHLILDVHRYDFIVKQAFGLRPCGALLALQGVSILGFAADVVTPRNDLGGLTHGVVDTRQVFLQQRVEQVLRVHAFQGHGDRLDAARHDYIAAARCHLVGSNRNGLQARGAETVEGHTRDVGAQSGQYSHVAADVHALGAFIGAGPDDAIIYQCRVDTGARQQSIDAMGRHVVWTGQIELATEGLGQTSSYAVNDHHFTHAAPHCYWG